MIWIKLFSIVIVAQKMRETYPETMLVDILENSTTNRKAGIHSKSGKSTDLNENFVPCL